MPPILTPTATKINLGSQNILSTKTATKIKPGSPNILPIKIPPATKIYLGLLNAQSLLRRTPLLHDLIADYSLDIVCLTETWLPHDAASTEVLDLAPPGYSVLHEARPSGRRGGGVAVVAKDPAQLSSINMNSNITYCFEFILVLCDYCKWQFNMCVLYRPPTLVYTNFFSDLSHLFDFLSAQTPPYIVMGDFNCPVAHGDALCDLFLASDLHGYYK
jgi:exonuclease III